jgi:hypothetical protein
LCELPPPLLLLLLLQKLGVHVTPWQPTSSVLLHTAYSLILARPWHPLTQYWQRSEYSNVQQYFMVVAPVHGMHCPCLGCTQLVHLQPLSLSTCQAHVRQEKGACQHPTAQTTNTDTACTSQQTMGCATSSARVCQKPVVQGLGWDLPTAGLPACLFLCHSPLPAQGKTAGRCSRTAKQTRLCPTQITALHTSDQASRPG